MGKMSVYSRLPIAFQSLACNCESVRIRKTRYGPEFWRSLNEYENRDSWTWDQMSEYRDARLRSIVRHCYETVPYYREIFDGLEIHPRDVSSLNDLKSIPILTKEIIKERFEDFVSVGINRDEMIWAHTNGTTGSGFRFLTTRRAVSEQWAVWWRFRRRLGITMDTQCALFGGKLIVPRKQKSAPYWRPNRALNQVYFSVYHINDNSVRHYVDALNSYRIKWIHGYPSAIALIAGYMLERGIRLNHKLDFLTTGSENLLEHQRDTIREAFGICPKQHYGLAEGVANISEGVDGSLYVDEDFAAVEFIEIGNDGKHIIGTSLTNYAMPLIRYDTKDIATVDIQQGFRRVDSIDGRKEDYITLRDGTRLGRLANVFSDVTSVREAQIFQDRFGDIQVRIVKTRSYSETDEEMILGNLRARLGEDLGISVLYVNGIERFGSGKLRFVVSEFDPGIRYKSC